MMDRFATRRGRDWTIPAQAAHWLDAGVESIERGRLQPAMDRMRQIAETLHHSRRRLLSGIAVAVSLFLAWHVFYAPNGMMVYQHKRAAVQKLQNEITALRKENDAYAQRVHALTTDDHAIEEEARRQFHKVRQGEIVYVTHGEAPPVTPATVTAQK